VFGGQIPRTLDTLTIQRNALVALSRLAEDLLLGETDADNVTYPVLVAGFKPAYPGNMNVNFGAGRVYEQAAVDTGTFGSAGVDARLVYQQGEYEASSLTFAAAPATVGHSRIDLVQVTRAEVDENGAVLLYYNSAQPNVPLNGPAGNNAAQSQDRTQKATLAIKQGTSGVSPVAPTADAGYTALFYVTIANGQTTITAPNVTQVATAPFIAGLTSQHHTGAPGSAPKIDLTTEVTGDLPAANGGRVKVAIALPNDPPTEVGLIYFITPPGEPTVIYASRQNTDSSFSWVILQTLG